MPYFMQFVAFLVGYVNRNCILQVMSLIVLPPLPFVSLNYHFLSQPHTPLLVSDMIFECSLIINSMWSHLLNDYFVALATRLIVEA